MGSPSLRRVTTGGESPARTTSPLHHSSPHHAISLASHHSSPHYSSSLTHRSLSQHHAPPRLSQQRPERLTSDPERCFSFCSALARRRRRSSTQPRSRVRTVRPRPLSANPFRLSPSFDHDERCRLRALASAHRSGARICSLREQVGTSPRTARCLLLEGRPRRGLAAVTGTSRIHGISESPPVTTSGESSSRTAPQLHQASPPPTAHHAVPLRVVSF